MGFQPGPPALKGPGWAESPIDGLKVLRFWQRVTVLAYKSQPYTLNIKQLSSSGHPEASAGVVRANPWPAVAGDCPTLPGRIELVPSQSPSALRGFLKGHNTFHRENDRL